MVSVESSRGKNEKKTWLNHALSTKCLKIPVVLIIFLFADQALRSFLHAQGCTTGAGTGGSSGRHALKEAAGWMWVDLKDVGLKPPQKGQKVFGIGNWNHETNKPRCNSPVLFFKRLKHLSAQSMLQLLQGNTRSTVSGN